MKDKIIQFASGDFSNSRSKLILSENHIVIEAFQGCKTGGSLYIGNDNGADMEGLIISEYKYLTVSEDRFTGKEVTINFVFNAEELQAGETINTELIIISSCGEVKVPVEISVGIPFVQYSGGRINDLSGFATAASLYPEEALRIFLSDDFKKTFLYNDIENQIIYDALIKCSDKKYALHEFLTATRKIVRTATKKETSVQEITKEPVVEVNLYEKLINRYLYYVCGKISADRLSEEIDGILADSRSIFTELRIKMCKAFVALTTGKYDVSRRYATECIEINKPVPGAPLEEVIEYSFVRYICAIVSAPEEMTQNAVWASKEIRYYYENGYNHYSLFWFLLNLDNRYHNTGTAYAEIVSYIRNGCDNPLIYYELCRTVKKDPDILHEWDNCLIEPLEWGVEMDLFNADMALVFTFHVSRIREYDEKILMSLKKLYESFRLDDTLQAICAILIRNEMSSEAELKWYELGIEKQVGITGIYESYMRSLPDDAVKIIPHRIILYFMYDNNLADREKELLFASVVRDKDNNPSIYKAYFATINDFARKKLEEGKINDALAVIYEDAIKINAIDELVAVRLPDVMFKYKIECSNSDMAGVCVIHKELEEEQYADLTNGEAYIDLYSGNAIIMLIDRDGNRYTGHEDYILKKMLRLDSYAEKCFEVSHNNRKLIAYMFIKMINEGYGVSYAEEVRKSARDRIKLRNYYDKKNTRALIGYYYENDKTDYLDAILNDIDYTHGREYINYFVERSMYDKAFNSIKYFGVNGVSEKNKVTLFEEYISKNGYEIPDTTALRIAYALYKDGTYTGEIIKYLANHFTGTSDTMSDIYKIADRLGINKDRIEEKLLIQLLFTEKNVHGGMPVFESYLLKAENEADLKKAYATYLAYLYIADNEEISDVIWQWIKDNFLVEQNIICSLAMIKKYSMKEERTEEEKVFCESGIEKMAAKGIILPFYNRFDGYRSRRYVMCVSGPGKNVSIRYKINDTDIYTVPMNEVLYGIYVREVVVFVDETITYELIAEKDGRKTQLGSGILEYVEDVSGEISRYNMINKMIHHYKENDIESLYSCMETYVKLEEASHSLFEIL